MKLTYAEKKELAEAEKLIIQIELDFRHAALDPSNRNHKRAPEALNQLKSKAAERRARLDAELYLGL
jgi:hypothetical protein